MAKVPVSRNEGVYNDLGFVRKRICLCGGEASTFESIILIYRYIYYLTESLFFTSIMSVKKANGHF